LQKYTNLYSICLKKGASYTVFLKQNARDVTEENSLNIGTRII